MAKKDPSAEYVIMICDLYGDVYDDREEDSKPGGEDWIPGVQAEHTSLASFQKQLEEMGIEDYYVYLDDYYDEKVGNPVVRREDDQSGEKKIPAWKG